MINLYNGVMDGVTFSIILLVLFIIAVPLVFWLIDTGRVKNDIR
jgi:hypothetical protein